MIHALTNSIRRYAWGSRTSIATLLGEPTPAPEPQAELWMGAHPGDPSRVEDGRGLDELVAADPAGELGTATVDALGPRLPFLMKLLAAGAPLSLQVHPTVAQAHAGYAEEDRRGVDLDDPARNYRDDNHKPEMICALTPFTGLVGFRPVHETRQLIEALDVRGLDQIDGLLAACPAGEGIHEAVSTLLSLDGRRRSLLVSAVGAACHRHRQHHRYGAELTQIAALARAFPADPGVVVALLMNLVVLRPGAAAFLPAGVLHAYLDGFGVEVLANSDNVLRGGLTGKHIDVPELLDVLDPMPARLAPVPERRVGAESRYAVAAREFRLGRIALAADAVILDPIVGPQILVATSGSAVVEQPGQRLELTPGRAAYVSATEQPLRISGTGAVHRCTVDLDAPGVP